MSPFLRTAPTGQKSQTVGKNCASNCDSKPVTGLFSVRAQLGRRFAFEKSRRVAIIYQALDFLGLFVLDRRAHFPCPIDAKKRLHRRKRPTTRDSIFPFVPICALCGKPVALEICKADAQGRAVHEDCYTVDLCPRPDGDIDSPANKSAGT
jgi:hypothetical protein